MILVPTLHPAALIRSRGGDDSLGLAKYEQTVLSDFAKALRLVRESPQWDERVVWERDTAGRLKNLFPTPEEVIEFCRGARGHLLAVDTETTGESPLDCRMLCVGMASANGHVMCVPMLSKGGNTYWSRYDAQRVADAVRELLAAQDTPKVAHNYVFDSIVLWSHGMPFGGEILDTMQMHHVIDSELPHGLGYCGTRYLDVRYWKDDVKGDEGWLNLPDETLRSYNLRDCLVTLRLVPVFWRELQNMGVVDLYREEVAVAGLMGRATVRGLPVDFVRRDGGWEWDPGDTKKGRAAQWKLLEGLGPALARKMDAALGVLRGLSGNAQFDPLKPVALRDLLFGRLGLPIVKLSKSGLLPSTDKEAMVLLALSADSEPQKLAIKALADFRSAHKAKSTFVDGLPVLGDGRLHVFWKMLTTTGRLASSPNAQNWARIIKMIFGWVNNPTYDSGRRFVGVDLAQAEMRGIAYLARSQRLLEMYDKDLNVHTINAAMALGVRPRAGHKDMDAATEQYLREQIPLLLVGGSYDTSLVEVQDDDKWKTTRTLIKKDGFGRNYGADDDTVFRIERSDRDSDTNELSFPLLTKSEVEANGIRWRKLNFAIVQWWDKVQNEVKLKGKHVDPVSGRVRWFREGFKRTHILGHPNQTLIASIVNKRVLEIQATYDRETGGDALIVQQVHDAVNSDVHRDYAKRAGDVMKQAFDQTVALPGFPQARFPADKPAVGSHLNDV